MVVSNTLNVKEFLKINLLEQKMYPKSPRWVILYHSDLSWYVSVCTVGLYSKYLVKNCNVPCKCHVYFFLCWSEIHFSHLLKEPN
jgi:hypothetical protein